MIIGVFDSGVGGLSVMKELAQERKGEFIYLGDSLRAPYGNKTKEEILTYSSELLSWLTSHGCTHFISACNSISVQDTDEMLAQLAIPKSDYTDMVTSTRKHLPEVVSDEDAVLIFGTQATIASGAYQELCEPLCEYTTLVSYRLAQAIEEGDEHVQQQEIQHLMRACADTGASHVILACTHYPLVIEKIHTALSDAGCEQVVLIDPASFVRKDVQTLLEGEYRCTVYTTQYSPVYDDLVHEVSRGHTTQIELLHTYGN